LERRKLGRTDLTVSRACLGTMTFGGQTDEGTASRIVDLCLDFGIDFFDTANVYNGGESECILGRVLGPRRSRIVLATKAGMKVSDHPAGLSRELVLRAAEDSLRRLRTDYIDVFYLHTPDPVTPLEETLGALDTLVRDGKVRYAATSNYASWQVCRMLWLCDQSGYAAPGITQPMYNLLARRIEDEFLPFCQSFGIGTVIYNPLAGGLLTGKHRADSPLSGSRFDGNQTYLDRYWHDANHSGVAFLSDAARRDGRSLVSVAVNWLLHHTAADCVILGASRVEQIEENLRALADGPLGESTLEACEQAWMSVRGAAPKYNR
jgi:aryl-alcohol dehydrogenase (NADP+)